MRLRGRVPTRIGASAAPTVLPSRYGTTVPAAALDTYARPLDAAMPDGANDSALHLCPPSAAMMQTPPPPLRACAATTPAPAGASAATPARLVLRCGVRAWSKRVT